MIGRHNPPPGLIATAKIPAFLIATHPETGFLLTPSKQTTAVLSNRNKKTPPGGCQDAKHQRNQGENADPTRVGVPKWGAARDLLTVFSDPTRMALLTRRGSPTQRGCAAVFGGSPGTSSPRINLAATPVPRRASRLPFYSNNGVAAGSREIRPRRTPS